MLCFFVVDDETCIYFMAMDMVIIVSSNGLSHATIRATVGPLKFNEQLVCIFYQNYTYNRY